MFYCPYFAIIIEIKLINFKELNIDIFFKIEVLGDILEKFTDRGVKDRLTVIWILPYKNGILILL